MERLIDANELWKQMSELREKRDEESNMTGDRTVCATWNDAVGLIKNAPTIDAEPVRHGKWLYGENESGHDGYYCSQCGEHIRWRYGEEDIDFIRSYNYCPHCGAKMTLD